MAPRQRKQKAGKQHSMPKNQNARPQGIKKQPPKHTFLSPTSNTPRKESPVEDRKRKRSQEDETPSRKRLRASPQSTLEDTAGENVVVSGKEINLIEYWTDECRWPKEYFEPISSIKHLLARRKSSSSLRERRSEASSATPSDQKPREAKSTPYMRVSYTTVLATKGSFMDKSDLGITDETKSLCRRLLEEEQTLPQDSLFRDDLFDKACRKIQDRNEARVVQDITRLIVPSAETLATYSAIHLDLLIESVNEGWNSAIPFYGPRPQPDYSVGFGRSAFTNDQLEKLKPFVGEVTDTFTSHFIATWQIYFPFLTCEVKCGAAALDVADRQNAHSMTLAVRGVVELFRLMKREKELYREILAFSISHNNRAVRIYGHYPIIDREKTSFYRHPIKEFSFTSEDGRDKWTSYKFIKNVYDIWMPTHLKRICSVIDKLPSDLDFEVSQQSDIGDLDQPSHDAASLQEEADSRSSCVEDITPNTSMSERIEGETFIKPRKRVRPGMHR